MPPLTTASVSMAVTPTVVSTLFSHYLNRKPLKERPTAHLSYDEGLHLVKSFLDFASRHTVEELQGFTSQWVPHPQWVKVDTVTVPEDHMQRAADLIQKQLGPEGIKQVGGQQWWQWRKPKSPLEAEWIEMRSDANERKKTGEPGKRVILYIHGGAYFFGSVDEHRYQMQRHARKLKARAFAPKYRLAPQFPFPCGLQDGLAAYCYLLTTQEPNTIILSGDSAGGGMALALLCLLRDQNIPMPAGGVLISPWVDLTHSFPSVAGQAPLDYIPPAGFHYKPSRAWPPPNEDDIAMIREEASRKKKGEIKKPTPTAELAKKQSPSMKPKDADTNQDISSSQETKLDSIVDQNKLLSVEIDGKRVEIKDQIQMYTANVLLSHPLVSPVMQPSLGGLPPLLIMVGGGEILRDEQIYMAHKCANPEKYAQPLETMSEAERKKLEKYKPTDVQLQVWDDLCHVAPTLSFTRPAKYMYRSIAQFSAWALARAQGTGIEIMDDDEISVISNSDTEDGRDGEEKEKQESRKQPQNVAPGQVGKAGDPLPRFKNHMIRQRVTRHGDTLPLAPESELPGCCVDHAAVGLIKEGPSKKWLATRRQWDSRFATTKAKVHKKLVKDMVIGLQEFGPGEKPPPSALAGRRRVDAELRTQKKKKSVGLALWSLWGSKHDETVVEREKKAEEEQQPPETTAVSPNEGQGARPFSDIESQTAPSAGRSRSRSRRRTVVDDNQTGGVVIDENTPIARLLAERKKKETSSSSMLGPDYVPPTGIAGKRPYLGGIASPFSLGNEAETASMMTLQSDGGPGPISRPMSPVSIAGTLSQKEGAGAATTEGSSKLEQPGVESSVTADALPQEKEGAQDKHT